MRAVLISIQPKWVFLIIAQKMGWDIGKEKTIEVRKDFPKADGWNKKVKIYCSKNKKSFAEIPKAYQPLMEKFLGKVIGEFVCDEITPLFNVATTSWELLAGNVHEYAKGLVRMARLTEKEIHDYAKGKNCFAWHISDLKIYDKPKELYEFGQKCDMAYEIRCRDCLIRKGWDECCKVMCKPLKRPPQSWCYVEELQNG